MEIIKIIKNSSIPYFGWFKYGDNTTNNEFKKFKKYVEFNLILNMECINRTFELCKNSNDNRRETINDLCEYIETIKLFKLMKILKWE